MRLGFSKSHADPNLYYKVVNNAPLILLPYVDDLFLTEVWQKHGEVFLGQGKYVINILQKLGMMDCKSMDTPMTTDIRKVKDYDSDPVDSSLYRQLVGSLMYLVNTRPDI
jgi:hypothetical protein